MYDVFFFDWLIKSINNDFHLVFQHMNATKEVRLVCQPHLRGRAFKTSMTAWSKHNQQAAFAAGWIICCPLI